jgi:AraC family transcriptional regulator
MSPRESRAAYERRMHKVLEHIDRHLDRPLDLATLAEVAHFSPFHFHRLFAAWMGETLGDYLRRRRLEVAAGRLQSQPRLTVLEAALAVGFGSGEAFSRAFKLRFGCSPSAWRENRNPDQGERKRGQALAPHSAHDGASTHRNSEVPMEVALIDREPVTVAYLRHTGPYGVPIGKFWGETVAPWMVRNRLIGQARYGISHDDPSVTDPERCRYDACAELPASITPAEKLLTTTLPGGRYAVLHFSGTAATIVDAWNRLLRDWLPDSSLQLDARPCFEYYPTSAKYDPKTGVFECDICIPVAPL